MADNISLNMDVTQSQKQTQRLIMLPQMQQAIRLLQLPVLELATTVTAEMERNPVLEYTEDAPSVDAERGDALWEEQDHFKEQDTPTDKEVTFDDNDFEILKQLDEDFRDHFTQNESPGLKRTREEEKRRAYLESSIRTETSLLEKLEEQAHQTFDSAEDLELAMLLIGYLDDSGFISTPLEAVAALHDADEKTLKRILDEIKTFDPPGVGAKDLHEALLMQLRHQGKGETLAYKVLENHYDELLHNKIPAISKALKCQPKEITDAIHNDITHLDLRPGAGFSKTPTQHIIPDVTVRKQDDDELVVETNREPIPQVRLNRQYLQMLDDKSIPEETKEFIKQKLSSAKWLMRNIDQRNDTVYRIAESLARHQSEFFLSPDGKLNPLTMKAVSEELELHESTIARAVANKYINSPRGIMPLRAFFTNAYMTERGEDISSNTVRDVLQKLIDGESKKKPLSDEALSNLIRKQGIKCARRTVAKYRTELGVGNAQQRRVY